jgi:RimJ/RimL family protein N-acetyltransferase
MDAAQARCRRTCLLRHRAARDDRCGRYHSGSRAQKGFGTAEWGFALGSPFWGNGMFIEGAQMVLDYAFEKIGVHRMEARCVVHNGRGNGVLQKLGAVREVRLHKSFVKNGTYYDEFLSVILDVDWTLRGAPFASSRLIDSGERLEVPKAMNGPNDL